MTITRARRPILLLAMLAALAAALGGCGDDEPVTFGEGKIPRSVPSDFPVPDTAVIGSTLVDRINNRTEFQLRMRSELSAVARYYTVGLVSAGYVVERSEGGDAGWTIEFSRGSLRGTVIVQPAGPGVSTAVVSMNRS